LNKRILNAQHGRIVVVGCKGFIGNAISKYLAGNGIDVLNISSEEFNLLDLNTIERLKKVLLEDDIVIFTSAIAPAKTIKDLQKTIKMAETFSKCLEKSPPKNLILISSDSVYGDKEGKFDEESSCDPTTYHGLSQLAREMIFKNSGLNCLTILRICAIYGPGDTHNGYGPNRFVNQIVNDSPIKLFGNGLNRRDHIYIDDVVNLILASVKLDYNGILNIATGRTYSFLQVAEECNFVFSKNQDFEMIGAETTIINKEIDISKLKSFIPEYEIFNLSQGLKHWKTIGFFA
jgi:nucleoside-diphosphate-sugar epimerase